MPQVLTSEEFQRLYFLDQEKSLKPLNPFDQYELDQLIWLANLDYLHPEAEIRNSFDDFMELRKLVPTEDISPEFAISEIKDKLVGFYLSFFVDQKCSKTYPFIDKIGTHVNIDVNDKNVPIGIEIVNIGKDLNVYGSLEPSRLQWRIIRILCSCYYMVEKLAKNRNIEIVQGALKIETDNIVQETIEFILTLEALKNRKLSKHSVKLLNCCKSAIEKMTLNNIDCDEIKSVVEEAETSLKEIE